jgi:hypothetical protein
MRILGDRGRRRHWCLEYVSPTQTNALFFNSQQLTNNSLLEKLKKSTFSTCCYMKMSNFGPVLALCSNGKAIYDPKNEILRLDHKGSTCHTSSTKRSAMGTHSKEDFPPWYGAQKSEMSLFWPILAPEKRLT